MAKIKEKQRALALRRQGKSIKDIAEFVGVSKGSVSVWCREIVLTSKQKALLKRRQIAAGDAGRIIGAEMNKRKRTDAITQHKRNGKKEIGILSKRDLLLLGIGLYWGEGVKSHTGGAALVNSDPEVILLAKQWFEKCLGVSTKDFNPYISISEIHKDREQIILRYWSEYLNIPKEQFHSIIFLKNRPKKQYENHDTYFGVLSLRIRRGTDLKYRIQGLIDACKND